MNRLRVAQKPVRTTILAALVAFTAQAAAADGRPATSEATADAGAAHLTRAREIYGFAKWPGKGGKLRPGPDAAKALAPYGIRLRFHWVRAPAKDKVHSGLPPGTVKAYWQTKQGPIRGVTVWVALSCEDAHEVLLRRLAWRTAPLGMDTRGKDAGINLGDVSFVASRKTRFVRGNVMVEVYDEANDAIRLAQVLDRALRGEPARKSLDPVRPRVRRLSVAGDAAQPLRVERCFGWAKPFPLDVEVVDPRCRRVLLYWEGTGGLKVREADSGGWCLMLPAAGHEGVVRDEKITLTAVNDTGVFARAELPVKVLVTKRKQTTGDPPD